MDCECLDVDVLSYSHLFETKTYYVNPPKVLHKVKRDLPHKPAHMKKMSTSKRRQLPSPPYYTTQFSNFHIGNAYNSS